MMLIRREDTAGKAIGPFALPCSPWQAERRRGDPSSASVEPAEELAHELARLQDEIAALEAAREEAQAARGQAIEKALEQGRLEGRRAADELAAERLAALREQLVAAAEGCEARLSETSDLAIEVARAAIHKILGEASPRAVLAGEVVRAAMAHVAAGTILAVQVSDQDFASDEELAALAAELGGVTVTRAGDLASGGCTFDLTLGTIDASLDVQLASLGRELDRLGGGAAS